MTKQNKTNIVQPIGVSGVKVFMPNRNEPGFFGSMGCVPACMGYTVDVLVEGIGELPIIKAPDVNSVPIANHGTVFSIDRYNKKSNIFVVTYVFPYALFGLGKIYACNFYKQMCKQIEMYCNENIK